MEDNEPVFEGCTCATEYDDEHTCPFAEEIHNDSETLCTCCAVCTYECGMNI